jgi:hypothetical protein
MEAETVKLTRIPLNLTSSLKPKPLSPLDLQIENASVFPRKYAKNSAIFGDIDVFNMRRVSAPSSIYCSRNPLTNIAQAYEE